ncbi:unnamed protein product [Camellia sinensis]
MVLSQKLHEAFKGTVERITNPRTVSAFKEKGVLSITEFVLAGDNLVSKCPTWSWKAASVEEEYEAAGGEVLLDNEDNDGWLATHGKPIENKCEEEENLPSMETLEISKKNTIQSISSYFGGDDEDIPDMEEYEEPDNLIETDPATLQCTYLVAQEPDDDNILRTRTYDVSITYDKYYQTPRVWLTGYDESRMLLRPELVLEDVSQDHARKTVTIEDHPHLPGKHASVHPCRHGAVMKKIIDVLMSRGVEPEVDKYLFLFLKFVASDGSWEFDVKMKQLVNEEKQIMQMMSCRFFAVISIAVFLSVAAAGDSSSSGIKSGTDSAISVTLGDSSGRSVWIPNLELWGLMGRNHDYFEMGNLDIFSGRGPCIGGPLCHLNLTSDGSGAHHGWFCEYIEVTSTGPHKECSQTIFYVDRWLATDAPPFDLTVVLDGCLKDDGPRKHGETGAFAVGKQQQQPIGSASE